MGDDMRLINEKTAKIYPGSIWVTESEASKYLQKGYRYVLDDNKRLYQYGIPQDPHSPKLWLIWPIG